MSEKNVYDTETAVWITGRDRTGRLVFVTSSEEYCSGKIWAYTARCRDEVSVEAYTTSEIFSMAVCTEWETLRLPEISEFKSGIWHSLFLLGKKALRGELSGKECLVSYSRLAYDCGFPGASRAVGNAMSSNPLLIVIPCHLVLPGHILRKYDGKTADVGNYRLGSGMKAALIRYTLNISEGLPF